MPRLLTSMHWKSARDGLTAPCIMHGVLAAAPLAAQSAGPRAHAAVLLAGGISENIAAPGVGASGAARVQQWLGPGCLSAGRGCEQGIRALGLQGSVGEGTRFAMRARSWAAGVRALTLERATGRRLVVTVL